MENGKQQKSAGKSAGTPNRKSEPRKVGDRVGFVPAPGPGDRKYGLSVEFSEKGAVKLRKRIQDTLEILYNKGHINIQQYNAGKRFQNDFTIASLDTLRAFDPNRVSTGREPNWDKIDEARKNVSRAMDYLGGVDTPAGAAVWHIIGLGEQPFEYVRTTNVYDIKYVLGMLASALCIMGSRYPIQAQESFK
ncbi:MAG: hypothetical protein HQL74_07480 [Magnetococcales bacterium]|nr:hypothetical protein [Magnetococcales bacterium]